MDIRNFCRYSYMAITLSVFSSGLVLCDSPKSPSGKRNSPTPPSYTLTVTETGSGSVISSDGQIRCTNGTGVCAFSYAAGTVVYLTAHPEPGFTFTTWNAAACDNGLPCNPVLVKMSKSRMAKATFDSGGGAPPSAPTCSAAPTGLPPIQAGVIIPALPEACAVPEPPVPTSTVNVSNAQELQAALSAAACGQEIVCAPGNYTGNFTVPALQCTANNWLYIHGDVTGYPANQEVPEDPLSPLPVWITPNPSPVVSVSDNAAYIYFAGIWFQPATTVTGLYDLITAGTADVSTTTLPDHIVFDRVWIEGLELNNNVRGWDINATNAALINSRVEGWITSTIGDGQGLLYCNAPVPLLVSNNFIQAATENLLLGGCGLIPGILPSDITITHNHLQKALSWFFNPPYPGMFVKNLFECKNCRRVLFDSNILDTTWSGAQEEAMILNGSTNPPTVISDVTISNNWVEHAPAMWTGGGFGPTDQYANPTRIMFRNNIGTDINGITWGLSPGIPSGYGQGFSWQWSANTTVDHNTILNTPGLYYFGGPDFGDGAPSTDINFVYTNNIAFGELDADSDAGAPPAVYAQFPAGSDLSCNVFVGDVYPTLHQPPEYPAWPPAGANISLVASTATPVEGQPACNVDGFPVAQCWWLDMGLVGFTDLIQGDAGANLPGLALAPTSQFKNGACDGADMGANVGAVAAAVSGIE